jgi:hypothetical protein
MTQHTFHTPVPVELEVVTPAGSIEVETFDGDESTITVEAASKLLEKMIVEQAGNRLIVEFRDRGPLGLPVSLRDFGLGTSRIRVHARIPHASIARLATASAGMELHGRLATLSVSSVSGALMVEGEVDGDVEVKTVSGDARLPRLGGDLTAQSVSGSISAAAVGRHVTARSVSGNVRIGSAREGKLTAQSVSGSIEVGVATGTSVDVDAGTASGHMSSAVALGSDPAVLGDGPRLVIRGQTVSGDFTLFRAA